MVKLEKKQFRGIDVHARNKLINCVWIFFVANKHLVRMRSVVLHVGE